MRWELGYGEIGNTENDSSIYNLYFILFFPFKPNSFLIIFGIIQTNIHIHLPTTTKTIFYFFTLNMMDHCFHAKVLNKII